MQDKNCSFWQHPNSMCKNNTRDISKQGEAATITSGQFVPKLNRVWGANPNKHFMIFRMENHKIFQVYGHLNCLRFCGRYGHKHCLPFSDTPQKPYLYGFADFM